MKFNVNAIPFAERKESFLSGIVQIKRLENLAVRLAVIIVAMLLNACAFHPPNNTNKNSESGVEYDSHALLSESEKARNEFANCKLDGLALNASARKQQSMAQYFASAQTFDGCLVDIDEHRSVVSLEERMQIHGLTILNYIKGGDVKKARIQLRAFELAYPDKDLYFSDYTSFVDTFRVLLIDSQQHSKSYRRVKNVNRKLLSEISRQRYWQTH